MIKGYPAYTCFGILSPAKNDTVKQIRFVDQANWVDASQLGNEDDHIWGEEKWDFSGRTDIVDVRFVLSYRADLSEFYASYGKDALDFLTFGVRVWNSATRRRSWHKGELRVNTSGKLIATFDSKTHLYLQLAQFSGRIEITPLIITNVANVSDFKRHLKLPLATIMGWANPIVIDLDKKRQGLSSLFEIKWESFQNPEEGPRSFFRVEWSNRPTLFLDDDNQELKSTLMSMAPTGRVARVRDTLNQLIAHQVVTAALSAAVMEVTDNLTPDMGPEELLESLSTQNALAIREWGWMLTQLGSDASTHDVMDALKEATNLSVRESVAQEIGRYLQMELGTEKAVSSLMSEMSREA